MNLTEPEQEGEGTKLFLNDYSQKYNMLLDGSQSVIWSAEDMEQETKKTLDDSSNPTLCPLFFVSSVFCSFLNTGL